MSSATKRGSLTIAGSGIASIAHITLETLAYIKESDKIFYGVCDPVTEAFIQENALKGTCFDLTVFYDKEKRRGDSYAQMAEAMLQEVRRGHDVLGVFYGHPGVFVSPSRLALATARKEGYAAKMLPGVSAEDYMFADLEFDPALYGCTTSEATELLLRNRSLDPSVVNIVWQVGGVGVEDMGFEKSKFSVLVDRLEKDFGPDHVITHYVGAVLPQSDTEKDTFTVAELRNPDVAKKISLISTFYIPPLPSAVRAADQLMASRLEYRVEGSHTNRAAAIAKVNTHTAPPHHEVLIASPAMKKFMFTLALNPKLKESYKADPAAFVFARGDELSDKEKFALRLGRDAPVRRLMKATREELSRNLSEAEIVAGASPMVGGPFFLSEAEISAGAQSMVGGPFFLSEAEISAGAQSMVGGPFFLSEAEVPVRA